MAGCFIRCCCGLLRMIHNCLILLIGSGNFISFIAMIVAGVATRWTRLRLDLELLDDIPLSGVVWYGLLYAEADVQNRDEIQISEFYDDASTQINVVRVFVALMLIFQIGFFIVLLPTEGCVGFCKGCICLEKIAEPLAVVLGILATASGAVAVIVWFFMTRNDTEDLVASAPFDGLIPADTAVMDDDFGWAFWIAVGAVALELLATIFVFGTCCLCCTAPKEEEEKEDIEAPAQAEPEDEDEEAEAEHEEEDLVEEEEEEEVEMEEEDDEEEIEDEYEEEEEAEAEAEPEAEEEAGEAEGGEEEVAAEEEPAEEPTTEEPAAEEPPAETEAAAEEATGEEPAAVEEVPAEESVPVETTEEVAAEAGVEAPAIRETEPGKEIPVKV